MHSLAKLMGKKSNPCTEKAELTTYVVEIHKIINSYFENLYLHRIENTEEMQDT